MINLILFNYTEANEPLAGLDGCMRSVAHYWPRFRTAGPMIIVNGGTKHMWTKKVREPIAVSECGYSTPIGRQRDDALYSR